MKTKSDALTYIKMKLSMKSKIFLSVIFFVAFITLIFVGYWFLQNNYQESKKNSVKSEIQQVIMQVEKLMELPKNELPELATVSDKSQLQQQAFFEKAENGDKVLFYTNAKKAILYRPSINKIVEVAPINIQQTTNNKQTPMNVNPTNTQIIKMAIYNGTDKNGYALETSNRLKKSLGNIDVVKTANASKFYDENLVVDFTGKLHVEVNKIISELGSGIATSSAVDETNPETDLLIILGK